MIIVASEKINNTQLDLIQKLGNGKSATGKRLLSEFNKRLEKLSPEELNILVHGDYLAQKQVAFLSICRLHGFIRDFVVEVLREKILMLDYNINRGNYLSFYRRKLEEHPEMERLTPISENKIRQVTFKILEQAGIIDSAKSKNIQTQLLGNTVINTIASRNKEWLKIFMLSDIDIQNIN